MRLTLRVTTYLAVLVVGFLAGFYATADSRRAASSLVRGFHHMHQYALQSIVLAVGTDDARSDALQSGLAYLAEIKANGTAIEENVYVFDTTYGYARLALIAQRQRDAERSAGYMEKAISMCLSGRSKKSDCTAGYLSEIADRLDRISDKFPR
jgi:hypothetical protein